MITASKIYWLTRLDAIHNALTSMLVIAIVLFVVLIICAAFSYMQDDSVAKWLKTATLIVLPVFSVVIITIATFVPTTKEAVAIYMLPKIADNKDIAEMPSDIAKFLNLKLQQWIDETLKTGKKQKGDQNAE